MDSNLQDDFNTSVDFLVSCSHKDFECLLSESSYGTLFTIRNFLNVAFNHTVRVKDATLEDYKVSQDSVKLDLLNQEIYPYLAKIEGRVTRVNDLIKLKENKT